MNKHNDPVYGIFLAVLTMLAFCIILGIAVAALLGTWQLISWLWSITLMGG